MTRAPRPQRTEHRRLSLPELLRTAVAGPRSRPLRTALSALGIAIGIASLTAITGIAASDRAQLLAELDQQGANLLVIQPGTDPAGDPVSIPSTAPGMLERVDGVDAIGVIEKVADAASVYRTSIVPAAQTGGLGVRVANLGLLDALDGTLADGEWFDRGQRVAADDRARLDGGRETGCGRDRPARLDRRRVARRHRSARTAPDWHPISTRWRHWPSGPTPAGRPMRRPCSAHRHRAGLAHRIQHRAQPARGGRVGAPDARPHGNPCPPTSASRSSQRSATRRTAARSLSSLAVASPRSRCSSAESASRTRW